jgi:hypothetical protein
VFGLGVLGSAKAVSGQVMLQQVGTSKLHRVMWAGEKRSNFEGYL